MELSLNCSPAWRLAYQNWQPVTTDLATLGPKAPDIRFTVAQNGMPYPSAGRCESTRSWVQRKEVLWRFSDWDTSNVIERARDFESNPFGAPWVPEA